MDNEIETHQFFPTLGDPERCGGGSCGQLWNHAVHNPGDLKAWGGTPKSYFRMTSSAQAVDESVKAMNDLNERTIADGVKAAADILREQTARRAGTPAWVDNAEVITPPHKFAMKTIPMMANKAIENVDFCDNCDCLYDSREFHPGFAQIRCPMSETCNQLGFNRPSHLVKHLISVHELDEIQGIDYLQNPWLVGMTRTEWQGRVPDGQWWRNYTTGSDAIKIQAKVDPEAVRGALQRFSDGLRAALPQAAPEAAGDPTEAHDEASTNPHKLVACELADLLTDWWMEKARVEVEAVVPKAVEYGATDLRDMGRVMAEMAGREVSDEEATELGVYFYALGKMARWSDAIKRGERVSDDTLHDLGVYCRMAQRTRDAGGWPGLPS